ncbi:MAG: hypothetical protein C0176_00910 [Mesoaciditoga sp.]|uniref:sensor histidine kinase n=1 Tax=Athalassotoga sp. TaxID=2022597 RepID=UPI000CC6A0B1|nr:MAG: hypothetical protein C0176_00910 [Mesoaciditoga sp.]HEU24621.1 HAMP domain-containing histidine kinase [Mesoaciditoga lauensis]
MSGEKTKYELSNLPSFLSNFTVKLNSAEMPEKCVEELIDASKNFFSVEDYAYVIKDQSHGTIKPKVMAMGRWVLEKKKISVIPVDDSAFLFLPLFSRRHDIGYVVMRITDDIGNLKMKYMDVESLLSFETSMVIDNMLLTGELIKKNEYVSEARAYLENVLNSLKYAVVVASVRKGEEFSNKPYKELIEKNKEIVNYIEDISQESLIYRKEVSREVEVNQSFYSLYAVPVQLSSGLKIVISIQDITNTKELERLQKIDKMKDNFVATISHELKTPLAAILAYSETLLESAESIDTDTLKSFAKTIKNESEHLANIIEEMINFSKVSSNSLTMAFGRVDLVKILKDTYDGLKINALSNNVKFSLEIPEDLVNAYVTADPKRIIQVMDNLVSNAFKYNDSKTPEVKINIRSEDEGYIISVWDNGSPIPAEEREKIFEKFYRGSNSGNISGTGLGLTIVKEIIDLHKGKIWIDDVENCSFSFFLPKRDWLNILK